ncbi:uncharacterized protein METZ01_LOCUS196694 [marine metagenome]|uniref:Uncharacterized protein n=1 Tax=marine metagenome TaxID=408172 RepID=A0A382DZF3_9ZZZZ
MEGFVVHDYLEMTVCLYLTYDFPRSWHNEWKNNVPLAR